MNREITKPRSVIAVRALGERRSVSPLFRDSGDESISEFVHENGNVLIVLRRRRFQETGDLRPPLASWCWRRGQSHKAAIGDRGAGGNSF